MPAGISLTWREEDNKSLSFYLEQIKNFNPEGFSKIEIAKKEMQKMIHLKLHRKWDFVVQHHIKM